MSEDFSFLVLSSMQIDRVGDFGTSSPDRHIDINKMCHEVRARFSYPFFEFSYYFYTLSMDYITSAICMFSAMVPRNSVRFLGVIGAFVKMVWLCKCDRYHSPLHYFALVSYMMVSFWGLWLPFPFKPLVGNTGQCNSGLGNHYPPMIFPPSLLLSYSMGSCQTGAEDPPPPLQTLWYVL